MNTATTYTIHYTKKSTKKNIRITSKFRFITFIVVLVLTTSIGFSIFSGNFFASGETQPSYETVQVVSGDTLWTIAERYGSDNQDIREVVYQLGEINHLDTEKPLTAGMEIKVPAE